MPNQTTFHTLIDREIPTVFVQMDIESEYSIDKNVRNIIPFVAVATQDEKYLKHYHRWQLPLEPAFACTTHKMQGITAKYGAVIRPTIAGERIFSRGLDYVAVSRPTELSKVYLLAPLTEHQFHACPLQRHEIAEEYNKLRNLHPCNTRNETRTDTEERP
jgi:hypothetical protein